jgi:hypothetical protein
MQVDVEEIRKVIISWIEVADRKTIERVYNENFDETINYNSKTESFEISELEAERVGLL